MSGSATLCAIVLAAGRSTRMGRSKPLLPWGNWTVIEQVVSLLLETPVDEVLVVTGHQHADVAACLSGWPVTAVYNEAYAAGEMLSSVQAGLRAAGSHQAALMTPADLPGIQPEVARQVAQAYAAGLGSIVFPSYQMRRGHPLLVDRRHWPAILALGPQDNLRAYFGAQQAGIHHVEFQTPGVLQDMDTPAEYERAREAYAPHARSDFTV